MVKTKLTGETLKHWYDVNYVHGVCVSIKEFYSRLRDGESKEDAIKKREYSKDGTLIKKYNSYKGDKVSYQVFTGRLRMGFPMDEAIKRDTTYKTDAMKYYEEYKGDKTSQSTYYSRISRGISMEDAIKKNAALSKKHYDAFECDINAKIKRKKKDTTLFIPTDKEVYDVYKREYERLIHNLECISDKSEDEIERLGVLNREFELFTQ